jgi:hypothetical protein
VLPALLAVAIVPGPVTVRAAVTTTVVIYLLFWVCGASMMLASRPPKRLPAWHTPGVPCAPGASHAMPGTCDAGKETE